MTLCFFYNYSYSGYKVQAELFGFDHWRMYIGSDEYQGPEPMTPQQLAERITKAKSLVVLTGAGVSTEAGLPDFRGPNGLYTTGHYDPERVFEINYFRSHPGMFFEFSLDLMNLLEKVQPTFTHRFLAELENRGLLDRIITQNIDTIHQMAGSRKIIEIHGSYWSGRCLHCGKTESQLDLNWWKAKMQTNLSDPVVRCEICGGVFKPDVVFFGENVHGMSEAQHFAVQCDLMLVLGSSLTVYPAAALPQLCRGFVAVVNKGPVELTPNHNRVIIQSKLDDFFKDVAETMDLRVDG